MIRLATATLAVAACLLLAASDRPVAAPDTRSQPMQFEMWTDGPAQGCGGKCRTWVSASGAITSETPRDFEAFAKNRKLEGATIALDSDGGSVLGALSLGRTIRRLGMITTVGKTADLGAGEGGMKRGRLQPKAYCESMCAFVLLAGVERHVPAEARVMVHQIWLGDRRDDPTAANYSAEDLVVVQRDIGRLAQYTVEMGGGIDMLEIALKIPPWEPMRLLTRDELRNMKVMTAAATDSVETSSAQATTTNSAALANGTRAAVNGRGWAMQTSTGAPTLARTHPLTVEGDDMGVFELSFSCGEAGRDYVVTYTEQRRSDDRRAPTVLSDVELMVGGRAVPLKVVSSAPQGKTTDLSSVANGRIPVELLKGFASTGNRSLTVETVSDDTSTIIRLGNAGIARAFPALAASCGGGSQPVTRSSSRSAARGG